MRIVRLLLRNHREITGRILQRFMMQMSALAAGLGLILLIRYTSVSHFKAAVQFPCLLLIFAWVFSLRIGLLIKKDSASGFAERFAVNRVSCYSFYWSYRLCSLLLFIHAGIVILVLAELFHLWPVTVSLRVMLRALLPWDMIICLGMAGAAVFRRKRYFVMHHIVFGIAMLWFSSWIVSAELMGERIYGLIRWLPPEAMVSWTRSGVSGVLPAELWLLPVFDITVTVISLVLCRFRSEQEEVVVC